MELSTLSSVYWPFGFHLLWSVCSVLNLLLFLTSYASKAKLVALSELSPDPQWSLGSSVGGRGPQAWSLSCTPPLLLAPRVSLSGTVPAGLPPAQGSCAVSQQVFSAHAIWPNSCISRSLSQTGAQRAKPEGLLPCAVVWRAGARNRNHQSGDWWTVCGWPFSRTWFTR